MAKRKLRVTEVLTDIRAGMDDFALMRKYDLSTHLLQSLFEKLLEAGVLERAEFTRREAIVEGSGGRPDTKEEQTEAKEGAVREEEADKITLMFETMEGNAPAHIGSVEASNGTRFGKGKELFTKPYVVFAAGALGTLLIVVAVMAMLWYSGQFPQTAISGQGGGFDVNASDQDGVTVLMRASLHGRMGEVKLLLDRGADVNAKDKDAETALMAACFYGHTNVVKLLLNRGADVNATSRSGWTALKFALARGNRQVADILLMSGARE